MTPRSPLFSARARRLLALVVLAPTLCATSAPRAEEREQQAAAPSFLSRSLRALGLQTPPAVRGDKAYGKGDHEEALRRYGQAARETAPDAPQRRMLDLNTGNALYRQERWTEAADAYSQALKRSRGDSGFTARAHHNLGNTHFRKAEAADSTDLPAAIADMRESVAHYKKALRLAPGDTRSKQNLERANVRLSQLLAKQQEQQQQQGQQPPPEPSPRAREALARALQLTQEGRYAEAAAVLDDILRSDRTAVTFTAHRQRLDDVQKILRGERPASPSPGDPRARPAARDPQAKPAQPGARNIPAPSTNGRAP